MASLNKVFLIGNLTRDPELRYAPSGTAVTTFSVATSRVYISPTGEKKQDVCYVRVVCWAKLAQICSEYLYKGRPVFIEGRLQSRSWQAQDGTKRSTLEIVAQNVQFLGKGKTMGTAAHETADQPQESQSPEDNPQSIDINELAVESAPQDEEVPF
ncbi:MAG: single-stranded DNA-binding protein [Candidatus Omnitrophica bacterium]|nr:single-stranded DNA-binding protein [Candidatus Omnitrophota bacterium]